MGRGNSREEGGGACLPRRTLLLCSGVAAWLSRWPQRRKGPRRLHLHERRDLRHARARGEAALHARR
jgi:hypothetical protein